MNLLLLLTGYPPALEKSHLENKIINIYTKMVQKNLDSHHSLKHLHASWVVLADNYIFLFGKL